MSNWWADKLGTTQRRDPGPAFPPPAPAGMVPAPPYPMTPNPGTPEVPPDPGDPYGHRRNASRWAGNPQGGAGESRTVGSCPSCGSELYFSRQVGAIMGPSGRAVPRPECASCGYPMVQGGGYVSVSAGTGSAPHAARQG